jgi:hypothetical protein
MSKTEPLTEETRSIIPAPVLPLVTPEEAAKQWALFEALKAKLLGDEDYQAIAGKRYIKRSGFRKIGVYFGISDRIIKEERTDRDDGSFCWHIEVEATAPNGRSCVGVGACDSRERKFAHIEHDCYSTAHTRAKSRAISDLVAGGAVSAEEVSSSDVSPEPAAAPTSEPEIQPRVPITKDPVKMDGLQQFPLTDGLKAVGMLNMLESEGEISVVPEKVVSADDPAIAGFLIPRVLEPLCAKHPEISFSVQKTADDSLAYVLVKGRLENGQVKELSNAARWAFAKATERTPK